MTTKILTALAGFVVGAAIVTGTALALDRTQSPTRSPAVAPMTMSGMTAAPASSATTRTLAIQHVLKGCHVWSDGRRQAASMSVRMQRGERLQIIDQDIDPHGLVQVAGPKIAIHGHMMMGQKQTIDFVQPGLYRFRTKVIEMGMSMNVRTIGPDNTLRLTVSVR